MSHTVLLYTIVQRPSFTDRYRGLQQSVQSDRHRCDRTYEPLGPCIRQCVRLAAKSIRLTVALYSPSTGVEVQCYLGVFIPAETSQENEHHRRKRRRKQGQKGKLGSDPRVGRIYFALTRAYVDPTWIPYQRRRLSLTCLLRRNISRNSSRGNSTIWSYLRTILRKEFKGTSRPTRQKYPADRQRRLRINEDIFIVGTLSGPRHLSNPPTNSLNRTVVY